MTNFEDRFLDNWSTQLRKGLLDLCVMTAMRGSRLYGYEIVKRLSAIRGLVISEGTIYPILSRLKREELVETSLEESPEGPARKYYRLTDRGRAVLVEMDEYWESLEHGLRGLREGER